MNEFETVFKEKRNDDLGTSNFNYQVFYYNREFPNAIIGISPSIHEWEIRAPIITFPSFPDNGSEVSVKGHRAVDEF